MRFLYLCCCFVLFSACGEQAPSESSPEAGSAQSSSQSGLSQEDQWKRDTALYFYRSLANYNNKSAAQYVLEPEKIMAMKQDEGFYYRVPKGDFEVKQVLPEGVLMTFRRFCYPDVDSMIFMERTGQGFRIDSDKTIREHMRNSAGLKPVRQYCYDFAQQPLQGQIMGEFWLPSASGSEVMAFPSGPQTSLAIHDERCEKFPDCKYDMDRNGSGYILFVDKLDFKGSGGNLGGSHYVRLYFAPDYNQSLYKGSYRITRLGDDRVRLELSVPEHESISLNGHFDLSLPASMR